MALQEKKDKLVKWFVSSCHLSHIEAQICVAGVVVVSLGTLLLLALNWDAKVLAILLSLSLCGSVTSFVSSLALLKGEYIQESFSVSIPFDTLSNNLPDLTGLMGYTDLPNDSIILARYTEMMNIGFAKPVSIKKIKDRKRAAQMQREIGSHFCGELLQYQILRLIYYVQRNMFLSMKLGQEDEQEAEEGRKNMTQSTVSKRPTSTMMLTKTSVCPGERLWEIVSGNRFAQLKSEQLFWKNGRFLLPDNTNVSLNYVVSSPIAGKEGYNVRFVKPMFFDLGYTVIPIAITDLGVLPPGLYLPDEAAETVRTFKYVVQMTANFDRLTSGNLQTDELKEWVRWLFRRIRRSLADAPEIIPDLPPPITKKYNPAQPDPALDTTLPVSDTTDAAPIASSVGSDAVSDRGV